MTISHRDGSKYEGVLHAFDIDEKGAGLELWVVSKKGALTDKAAKPEKRKFFRPSDVVRVDCKYSLHDDLLSSRTQGARSRSPERRLRWGDIAVLC